MITKITAPATLTKIPGRDRMESDGYTSDGEDGDDESDSSGLEEDSFPEEEIEVKSEDNYVTEEEASLIHLEESDEMLELTDSEKSEEENEMS